MITRALLLAGCSVIATWAASATAIFNAVPNYARTSSHRRTRLQSIGYGSDSAA